MGLLDSDEEELRRAPNPTGSGRKVNQSGLGAFKGINKYSNLTAKYRATAPASTENTKPTQSGYKVDTQATVEQSRGTIDDSKSIVDTKLVQSTNEVGTIKIESIATKVDTNKLQSGYELDSKNSTTNFEVDTKSVQKNDGNVAEEPSAILIQQTTEEVTSILPPPVLASKDDSNQIKQQHSGYKVGKSLESIYPDSSKSLRSSDLLDNVSSSFTGYNVGTKIDTSSENTSSINVGKSRYEPDTKQVHKSTSFISQSKAAKSKSVQSGNKVDTNLNVPTSKPDTISIQSRYLPDTIVGTKKSNKLLKTYSDSLVPLESVLSQMGDQKQVVDFIYDQCVWTGSLVTPPITKQQMLAGTGVKADSLKMSIKRLREKQIIDKDSFKDGKGGWTKYKISEIAYRDLTNLRKSISLNQNIYAVKVGTNLGTNPPSKIVSSNLNNLPILTSTEVGTDNLNKGWFKTLDFSKVRPIGAMQVNSSIRNLIEQKLDQDDAQNFINRFMPWMSLQTRVNNPLGLFCDKFKEYATEGDSAILLAATDEERQIEIELAQRFEKMRAENELVAKHKEEQIKRRTDEEFEVWLSSLSREEKISLVPTNSYMSEDSAAHRALLKERFIEAKSPQ